MENYKQIKTYEDALKVLGREDFNHENLYPREIARRKLEIIIEALNEGWKPDLEDTRQVKYMPYFYKTHNGIYFSVAYSGITNNSTNISLRLTCKSEEIAKYVGTQFIDLYRETLLG